MTTSETLLLVMASVSVFLIGYQLGVRHGADLSGKVIYWVIDALADSDDEADSDE